MSFNFDNVLDRRNSDSGKWNMYPADVLPLWVADMDFLAPPAVIEALKKRADQGTFGYGSMGGSAALREAIRTWAQERYQWNFAAEEIHFLPNLVSALFAWARVFGEAGDEIAMLLPNYPPFMMAASSAGRTINRVDMIQTEAGGVLRHEIDFEALEKAITPRTKMIILCNPHNPVGRMYTRAELEKLAELALKHELVICSDEIHADLRLESSLPHIPIASLSPQVAQRTIP
jgi:cystathionine beta-lyase